MGISLRNLCGFVFVLSFSEKRELEGEECGNSVYGCCPDGVTAASGPDYNGCMPRDRVPEGIDCALSHYGCCSDGHTAAQGPDAEGCPTVDCRVVDSFRSKLSQTMFSVVT